MSFFALPPSSEACTTFATPGFQSRVPSKSWSRYLGAVGRVCKPQNRCSWKKTSPQSIVLQRVSHEWKSLYKIACLTHQQFINLQTSHMELAVLGPCSFCGKMQKDVRQNKCPGHTGGPLAHHGLQPDVVRRYFLLGWMFIHEKRKTGTAWNWNRMERNGMVCDDIDGLLDGCISTITLLLF